MSLNIVRTYGKIKTVAVALLLAAVVPAVAFTLYFLFLVLFAALAGETNGVELKTSFVIFLAALTISTAHVVFLGLPTVWLLNKLNQLRLWTVVAAGSVTGCIPMAIWYWPVEYSGYRSSYSYWDGEKNGASQN